MFKMPTDEDHLKTLKAFWLILCSLFVLPVWIVYRIAGTFQELVPLLKLAEFAERGTPFLYILSWIMWFQIPYGIVLFWTYMNSN